LVGVAYAQSPTPLSRKYAQKSLALTEFYRLHDEAEEVQALLEDIAEEKLILPMKKRL